MTGAAPLGFAIVVGALAGGLHLWSTWRQAVRLTPGGEATLVPAALLAGFAQRVALVGACLAVACLGAARAAWAFPVGFVVVRWLVLWRVRP